MQRLDRLSETGKFNTTLFDISTLDDEIKVDHLCESLLRIFAHHQVNQNKVAPAMAGKQAHGADYFLREFIIGDRRENLFSVDPTRVRQFAGNWYIVRALEPNCQELGAILHGTAEFYQFISGLGLYPISQATEITRHCQALDYYQERVDSFWEIKEDGYTVWFAECPIES